MKKLENFIRDNRDDFDSKLPSVDLWDKIESQLSEKESRRFNVWKLTASIAAVLVIALAGAFFLNKDSGNDRRFANISDPEMKNLLETEAFYSEKVSSKINEIEKCYKIYPDLKVDIENDLNELDNMYKELENDLKDNFYNKEVIEAMIQNNRLRLEMVDRVLDQINC